MKRWEGPYEFMIRCIPVFRRYRIDTNGDVYNRKRKLIPDIDDRGRRRFTLCRQGVAKKFLASRLVLLTFVGPCPAGLEACHDNGKYGDDSLSNLRWDTHSANLLDRRRHGTANIGERNNTSKLTADAVLEIRRVGLPLRQHAEKYQVTESLICAVLKRKVWTHV